MLRIRGCTGLHFPISPLRPPPTAVEHDRRRQPRVTPRTNDRSATRRPGSSVARTSRTFVLRERGRGGSGAVRVRRVTGTPSRDAAVPMRVLSRPGGHGCSRRRVAAAAQEDSGSVPAASSGQGNGERSSCPAAKGGTRCRFDPGGPAADGPMVGRFVAHSVDHATFLLRRSGATWSHARFSSICHRRPRPDA